MSGRRLVSIVLVALLLAALLILLLAVREPTPVPRVELHAGFTSGGKRRTFHLAGRDMALIADPGSRVELRASVKDPEGIGWQRRAGEPRWSFPEGRPPTGARPTFSLITPVRTGAYRLRYTARLFYGRRARWPLSMWRCRVTARAQVYLLVPVPRHSAGAAARAAQVTLPPDAARAYISPSYQLGRLASLRGSESQSALISYALLDKLEATNNALRRKGHLRGALRLTSVYRTPEGNRRLSGAERSQHLLGLAADAILDEAPADGLMDDLNGDGRVDRHDCMVVARVVRELERGGRVVPGGIGVYEFITRDGIHTASLHLDVRGTPARWARRYPLPGDLVQWHSLPWPD